MTPRKGKATPRPASKTSPGGRAARRERVVSVTRELIGELGIEAITMRDLAHRCNVAVATLYNQFGSREAIIAAALRSDFEGRFEPLSHRTQGLGPAEKLRARISESARSITGPMRDYTRSVMFFYFHYAPDSTLRAAIHDFVAADFMTIARELELRGDLQPWVRVDTFADDLITQLYGLVMKWSQGYIADRHLRARLLHAASASFIGISRGRSREEFEKLAAKTR